MLEALAGSEGLQRFSSWQAAGMAGWF